MTLAVGVRIPEVTLRTLSDQGPKEVPSLEALGRGRTVLFGVPGAFTPTCSDQHLPGFVVRADEIGAKGVGTIACLAVNDPFVMAAWAKERGVGESILMLSDGNGEFTRAAGLEFDGSGFGLGTRSQRYAAVLQDGVVTALFLEHGPGLEVSSAERVLAAL
ncbi:MAG: peroxiredoxin [Acidimicrobiales bacterium]